MSPNSRNFRRTYFNHPLVEESLQCLPAALQHRSVEAFRQHVVEHVPQNSLKGRQRIAGYLLHRFAPNGELNLPLSAAVARFSATRGSAAKLYSSNYCRCIRSCRRSQWSGWTLPPEGSSRAELQQFLEPRIPGRSTEKVAKDSMTTMFQCGKVARPKVGWYRAVWANPPIEVFVFQCSARLSQRPPWFASISSPGCPFTGRCFGLLPR